MVGPGFNWFIEDLEINNVPIYWHYSKLAPLKYGRAGWGWIRRADLGRIMPSGPENDTIIKKVI
jgi:hypothetical protein